MRPFNCIILGAAGRDFHDFQVFFRRHPEFHVRGFTATQIPYIESRTFPRELAGENYSADIPIFPESELPRLIRQWEIDFVFLAYSDLSHEEVMHKASLVQSCGAAFALLGPRQTQLTASCPVIAITAVRTGAGKSPLSQRLARHLAAAGRRVGVLRHPMPYGNLSRQAVQRLADWDDLRESECTVEEREEYAPYIAQGQVVFAGVDYQRILEAAQAESDALLWDGGNNDYPFLAPDLWVVIADALRPGHETRYYPGETNLRAAHVIVINKVGSAEREVVERMRRDIRQVNGQATLIEADLEVRADEPEAIRGKRVLVVEDGPTLTHGGMSHGAGSVAARRCGAAELIDPRPFAVGSIAEAYRRFPHLDHVLPALGYSPRQLDDLVATIERSDADVVVDASPAQLDRLVTLKKPLTRIHYEFQQRGGPDLLELVDRALADL